MTLASKKSLNTFDLGNVTPFGIGGPKDGTSLDLVTATLNELKEKETQCFTLGKFSSFCLQTIHSLNFSFLSNMPEFMY